ncbi:hypothetical protein WAI453_003582 [Rhynchosporium graminicola]
MPDNGHDGAAIKKCITVLDPGALHIQLPVYHSDKTLMSAVTSFDIRYPLEIALKR